MKTIKDLINKIKYDKKEKGDYSLFYIDRIENNYKEIKFKDIKRIEGNFLIINKDKETEIPLHRIKIVKKNGMVIWRRIT